MAVLINREEQWPELIDKPQNLPELLVRNLILLESRFVFDTVSSVIFTIPRLSFSKLKEEDKPKFLAELDGKCSVVLDLQIRGHVSKILPFSKLVVWDNDMVIAFDKDGNQIPEWNGKKEEIWEKIRSQGIDPDCIPVERQRWAKHVQ